MAAISVTCTKYEVVDGKHYLHFGKQVKEFTDVAQAREFVRGTLTREVLIAMLIAQAMEANDPASIVGKTIIGNPAVQNMVRVP